MLFRSNGSRVTTPRQYFVGATVLIAVGLVLGLGISAGFGLPRATRAADAQVASLPISSAALPESPFVGLVSKALPAVVFIDVTKKVGNDDSDDPQQEMMRRFFGQGAPRQQRVPSSGSGFIFDASGRILTNNHVVKDADNIKVTLNDGREFKATVVGTDPATDVAVIKIEGRNLPHRPVGVMLGKGVNNGWGGYQAMWGRTMLACLVGALEVPEIGRAHV